MRGERREGFGDLDPDALVADAEEHIRRRGALGARCVDGVRKLGAEDLQRREGVVHGRRARSRRRRTAILRLLLLANVLNARYVR
jgi:hypothetical protein